MEFTERDPFEFNYELSLHKLLIDQLSLRVMGLELENSVKDKQIDALTRQSIVLTKIITDKVRFMEVNIYKMEKKINREQINPSEIRDILTDSLYDILIKED